MRIGFVIASILRKGIPFSEKIVAANARNEWAEGTYLESDIRRSILKRYDARFMGISTKQTEGLPSLRKAGTQLERNSLLSNQCANMTNNPKYHSEFYDQREMISVLSARVILPLLLDVIEINSIVDFGCGDGGWLAVAQNEFGVSSVLGIDGPWVREDQLKIAPVNFRRANLDEPLALDKRVDLAMSLEVAEHLPAHRAKSFVGDLVSAAPVVLFSAAIPHQGGVNHVNEQWQDYWSEIFAGYDFRAIDWIRPRIWRNEHATIAYRQNMILYVNEQELVRYPKLKLEADCSQHEILAAVHPDLYEAKVRRNEPRIGRWLKMGPAAVRRTFTRRR